MIKQGLNYICADRGSDRCPCHLMEIGQCYTCTMLKSGVCDCDHAGGWQGSCPYTEYEQQGRKSAGPEVSQAMEVVCRRKYGEDLVVMTIKAGTGFAVQCRRPGAYVMVDAFAGAETDYGRKAGDSAVRDRGWRTPLSVLAADPAAGTVDFVLRQAGPKTRWLTGPGRSFWLVTGPFYNGLLHSRGLDSGHHGQNPDPGQHSRGLDPERHRQRTLAVVRGTALAPYLCASASLSGKNVAGGLGLQETGETELYLDVAGLTEEFVADYLVGHVYERIDLSKPADLAGMRDRIREGLRVSETLNVMALVSPYYMKRLTDGLTWEERERLICLNPANLCCGEGICGACSHTDRLGQTVRLCKCNGVVVE